MSQHAGLSSIFQMNDDWRTVMWDVTYFECAIEFKPRIMIFTFRVRDKQSCIQVNRR